MHAYTSCSHKKKPDTVLLLVGTAQQGEELGDST
jgi:hypothetical protein